MGKGKIYVAGIGPGSQEDITPAVRAAVSVSDVIVGYKYYFSFIQPYVKPDAVCVDTGMRKEQDRAALAFDYAGEGKCVCVISSGDAGIYGMAPLVWHQCFSESRFFAGGAHRARFLCHFPVRFADSLGKNRTTDRSCCGR